MSNNNLQKVLLNKNRYSKICATIEEDARDLNLMMEQLARNGIPTGDAWLRSMKDDHAFKDYIDEQCRSFLSGAKFVPMTTKNDIKVQYAQSYEQNKFAVSRASSILCKCYATVIDEQTGLISIDVDKSKAEAKESCLDVIDTDKLQDMAEAIKNAHDAIMAIDTAAASIGLPQLSSGVPCVNDGGYFSILTITDILNRLASVEAGEHPDDFALSLYGLNLRSPKKAQ